MAALAINDLPDGRRVLALDGRLDSNTVRAVWSDAHRALADAPGKPVTVDAAKVDYCDGAGVALLIDLIAQERAAPVEIANLKPAFELLLKQFDPKRVAKDIDPEVKRRPAIEEIGRAAAAGWRNSSRAEPISIWSPSLSRVGRVMRAAFTKLPLELPSSAR